MLLSKLIIMHDSYLSAQLEDSQCNRDNEREEGQLEGVECLDAQDTETQWHQCDGLQEDKGQDWDGDFLQLRFA